MADWNCYYGPEQFLLQFPLFKQNPNIWALELRLSFNKVTQFLQVIAALWQKFRRYLFSKHI